MGRKPPDAPHRGSSRRQHPPAGDRGSGLRLRAQLRQHEARFKRRQSVLQSQLAAIQAPPLSAADQRQGLPALKADLLSQIKTQETSLLKQAGPRVPTEVLIKDSLRVLLLAPLMAMGFAVSARRSTPPPLQAPVLP
ncbi:MAG: hypothetical protein NTW51_01185 [Cyanobacteria bacterium]|nr:hypothetical protein [Cyanobacteriota bacterium]